MTLPKIPRRIISSSFGSNRRYVAPSYPTGTAIEGRSWDYAWAGDGFTINGATALYGGVDLPAVGGGPAFGETTYGLENGYPALGTTRINKAAQGNGLGIYRYSAGLIPALAAGLTDITIRVIAYLGTPTQATTFANIFGSSGQFWRVVNATTGKQMEVRYRSGVIAEIICLPAFQKNRWFIVDTSFDNGVTSQLTVQINGLDYSPAATLTAATGWSVASSIGILCNTGAQPSNNSNKVIFLGIKKGVVRSLAEHQADASALGLS